MKKKKKKKEEEEEEEEEEETPPRFSTWNSCTNPFITAILMWALKMISFIWKKNQQDQCDAIEAKIIKRDKLTRRIELLDSLKKYYYG